ncbi:hypothetical protein VNO77_06755 [Canavalia gladiata]|uniref:Dof zinc finger protein n=1 Tax=Canavalia gladiata TaxID=3824 RepID=A0AAN9M7R7_CANGL
MEGIAPNSCGRPGLEKKARPQEQLNCPRCNSTNTKFCYYNNYSLTQPRYFCKTCRRYWTEGGSLRNVPVGGGSRKNKKIISAASSSSSSSSKIPDLNPPTLSAISSQNPKIMHGGQDLNLAFPAMDKYHHHGMSPYVEMQNSDNTSHHQSSSCSAPPTSLSALELLRSSMASRGLNPYAANPSLMPNSNNNNALYPSGFPMQEVKPSLGFSSVDGIGNHQVQERGGRVLFPFGDHVKQLSTTASEVEHNKEQGNPTGYWTGMIGEGTW